jgi:hypothetical protein
VRLPALHPGIQKYSENQYFLSARLKPYLLSDKYSIRPFKDKKSRNLTYWGRCMTQEFDPKKSYLKIKAHEKMIAYVGFVIRFGKDDQRKEGVIKISSFQRPYGGGYITLTFIVDTEDNQELKAHLKKLFNNLTEDSLKPYLEKDMEKIVKVSLDSLEEIPQWYIEEISVQY